MSIKNFFDGGKQISDSLGVPLNGGKCNFYEPTTTTPKTTYTTAALTVANANPAVLDSAGRANVWLNGNYRVIVQDSSSNTIYDEDNINPDSSTTVTALSSPTTLDANYNNRVIEVSGATTLTLTSAATLGSGWNVETRNVDTTNNVTIARANSGNTINGIGTNVTMYPGDAFLITVNSAADGFFTLAKISNEVDQIIYGNPGFTRNYSITATVAASALTIALKGADAADPANSNPVPFSFRSATATAGTYSYLRVTAASSLVISSGSTLGTTSGVASRTWIVCFNDGGTFRLGAINCSTSTNIYSLIDNGIASSTAEGGAGAADSAGVIYTGTAVTSKAMRVLGYIESTQATAGTWATAPSRIQLWTSGMKLPGDVVQIVRTSSGAVATGTTTTPTDDTIPQVGEGDQYMTYTITPTSAINYLYHQININGAASATSNLSTGLFQDGGANAIASIVHNVGANNIMNNFDMHHQMLAAGVIATTFTLRVGLSGAGTFTFNGQAAGRIHGGVAFSSMRCEEVMG